MALIDGCNACHHPGPVIENFVHHDRIDTEFAGADGRERPAQIVDRPVVTPEVRSSLAFIFENPEIGLLPVVVKTKFGYPRA